jgi:hypothetical protein
VAVVVPCHMEKRKRVLVEKHPDTLTSIANLALTYRDQGRWKEAEEYPQTLSSIVNLAYT